MTTKPPRVILLILAAFVAATLALTGCGPQSTAGSAAGAPSTSVVGGASTGTGGVPSTCPTQNTRAFAKTRLVADLGLTAGTFHRYIYKPFKAGAFDKGANGRVLALVKAAATAAADAKLLSNAVQNIQANPTLCHVLYQPMVDLGTKLSALKTDVTSGNLGNIDTAGSSVSGLLSKANSNGLGVTETTNPAGSSQG